MLVRDLFSPQFIGFLSEFDSSQPAIADLIASPLRDSIPMCMESRVCVWMWFFGSVWLCLGQVSGGGGCEAVSWGTGCSLLCRFLFLDQIWLVHMGSLSANVILVLASSVLFLLIGAGYVTADSKSSSNMGSLVDLSEVRLVQTAWCPYSVLLFSSCSSVSVEAHGKVSGSSILAAMQRCILGLVFFCCWWSCSLLWRPEGSCISMFWAVCFGLFLSCCFLLPERRCSCFAWLPSALDV